MKPEMPEIDSGADLPPHAVRVYGENDAFDEFPVLKAFQQYIDAEQSKARKRMLTLSIFFSILISLLVIVFVILLNGASNRNQQLNDKLLDYVMKDRERSSAAVVVQPSDNTALMQMTAKLESLQQKVKESQEKAAEAEKARAKAEEDSASRQLQEAKAKAEATRQEQEIGKLKALLAAAREKAAAEAAQRKEEELEAYRRKHYPDLYEKPKTPKTLPTPAVQPNISAPVLPRKIQMTDQDVEDILREVDGDSKPLSYFDESEEESEPEEKNYAIPVEIKGSRSSWHIPDAD